MEKIIESGNNRRAGRAKESSIAAKRRRRVEENRGKWTRGRGRVIDRNVREGNTRSAVRIGRDRISRSVSRI